MQTKTIKSATVYSFDIDGVIVDTASRAIKHFNKKYRKTKKVTDLKSFFIIYDWLFEILDDKESAMDAMVKLWNDPEVLTKSLPIKGALELTKSLHRQGSTVHYITSRPNTTKDITRAWFKKWLPWVNQDLIHISPSGDGLQRSFKAEMIKSLRPDVHFEDSIEHAQDITRLLPETKVILVRQPWNYTIAETLPISVIIPEGRNVKRNLMASYEYYLSRSRE